MKKRRDILHSFKTPALCVAFLLPLIACTPEKATGPTVAQTVMNAQRAAKTETPPMSAAEADAVYKNYIENIGKPVRPTSGFGDDTMR